MRTSSTTLVHEIKWPTSGAKHWVEEFIERHEQNADFVALIAIGSAIRPVVASNDLDLLAIFTRLPSAQKAPVEIDLKVVEAEQIDRKIKEGNDLLIWALNFGVPLSDRRHRWQQTLDRWQGYLPLPDEATSRTRASKSLNRTSKLLEVGDTLAALEEAISYLTHLSRAELIVAGIHPASRPELPSQLRSIGGDSRAAQLESLLQSRNSEPDSAIVDELQTICHTFAGSHKNEAAA
jgi:hypothetical protein